MLSPQKIVLVGPMGAGKTTIGKLLAQQLNLPFKDSDAVVEERSGADIPWIFDVEGEEGFRQRESSVLKDLLAEKALVLATGGGIVIKKENRQLLKNADMVIYLSTDSRHLLKRTQKDKNRPLLNVSNPEQQIQKLLTEREPLYRKVATRIVTTDTRSPKIVAKEIAQAILNSSIRIS